MDSAKKVKIYALYNDGVTTANIAERFCLTRNYVADVVRKMKQKKAKH
jgi:Mor family transcriptional regulator